MSWMQKRVSFLKVSLGLLAGVVLATMVHAQSTTHFMGTVSVISGNAITVKTAQGDEHQVQVPANADVKSIAPGQTSLSAAVPMAFSDIAVGDRVLVYIDPNSAAGTQQAQRVVAIKAADLAKKHEQEAQDWQQNGVGGLVKSVNPTSGDIVINSGVGAAAKVITVHTNSSTALKRYAPASVSYEQAQAAPISTIHAGDQLKARGEKNSVGTEVTAVEVVSGSFRNISGVIASVDPAHSTFTLKDLATKKPVTVQVPEDAQMRKLPERMAQALGARLKGTTPGQGGGASSGGASGGANGGASGDHGAWTQHGGNGGGGGSMDPEQMLSRAPVIHFADLQKGDAVMLVGTAGDTQVTAITLISGVEPLLEAPAGQNLLANWSMGSGEAAAGGAQ